MYGPNSPYKPSTIKNHMSMHGLTEFFATQTKQVKEYSQNHDRQDQEALKMRLKNYWVIQSQYVPKIPLDFLRSFETFKTLKTFRSTEDFKSPADTFFKTWFKNNL